jgi:hypothetical protein
LAHFSLQIDTASSWKEENSVNNTTSESENKKNIHVKKGTYISHLEKHINVGLKRPRE